MEDNFRLENHLIMEDNLKMELPQNDMVDDHKIIEDKEYEYQIRVHL